MSLDAFETKSNLMDSREYVVRGVGGSSAVTQVSGKGVTLTRTSAGLYLLTWSDAPGNFLGATHGFQATTPAALAGYTLVFGAYDATAFTLAFSVYIAADTILDLAALQWVTVCAKFSPSTLNAV